MYTPKCKNEQLFIGHNQGHNEIEQETGAKKQEGSDEDNPHNGGIQVEIVSQTTTNSKEFLFTFYQSRCHKFFVLNEDTNSI